jgi:hypothetical protein
MARVTVGVLQAVIALALVGSVIVQTLIIPAVWVDLEGEPLAGRIAYVTLLVLGVVTMQVFAVCVWRLLTKVRTGSVFSPSSFLFVNIIVGAIAAAAALMFAMAILLALGEAAPGVVGLVCGAALVLAGVALLVVVMKALLRQAIQRESEVVALRTELNEMI